MIRKWLHALDTYANATYGESTTSAIVRGTCVSCGRRVQRFRSAAAASAYLRIGLCERCQPDQALQSMAEDRVVPFERPASRTSSR